MEPKHFNLLAVAAVVSLVAAGVVHGAYNDWTTESFAGEKLLPGFDRDANQVHGLAVQKGKAKLTLKRSDTGWVIVERANYPAKPEAVRKLLVGLATAELIEPKTRVESKYALLDLEDPKKDDTKATLINLTDKGGKTIADVILGKRKVAAFGTGRAGTYVRRPGKARAWLASENLSAPVDVSNWVEPVFFRIDPKTVKSLSVTAPKAQPYLIVAEDAKAEKFKFSGIPEGTKLKSGVSASSMVTSMKTLELLDVKKIETLPMGDKVHAAMLETADGMKIDLRLRAEDADRWISLKVVADGKNAEAAKALRASTEGWEFKVADWRARQTFKSSDDLFEAEKKPVPAPKAVPPQAGAPDPATGPAAGTQN